VSLHYALLAYYLSTPPPPPARGAIPIAHPTRDLRLAS